MSSMGQKLDRFQAPDLLATYTVMDTVLKTFTWPFEFLHNIATSTINRIAVDFKLILVPNFVNNHLKIILLTIFRKNYI